MTTHKNDSFDLPRVYLVGGGPGDPGLLTRRGAACLARADIVLYDRLSNPVLLNLAPPTAERIYVGKRPDHHPIPQDSINQLILTHAQAGKTVVRLHGGDPFVFGRGGEEAEALAAVGIPFEVVPGITSAIAAPAYAGIPVTHRDYASSFAVVTGHRRAGAFEDLPPFPDTNTLVFLMPVHNLEKIVARLLANGRSPQTPAALIHRGAQPQQKTVIGSLSTIIEQAKAIKPPAAFIIGDVVQLHRRLAWIKRRPLLGKRILITRPRHQAGELADWLMERGAEPVLCPVIKIAPPQNVALLDAALTKLDNYDWIVFTSANGVKYLWARLQAMGKDARAFGNVKIAAVGAATAVSLSAIGITADFTSTTFTRKERAAELPRAAGERALLPRVEAATETMPDSLTARGVDATTVAAYRVLPVSSPEFDPAAGDVDMIALTSGAAVRAFAALLDREPYAALKHVPAACIGPATAAVARKMGLDVGATAVRHSIVGLGEAIMGAVSTLPIRAVAL